MKSVRKRVLSLIILGLIGICIYSCQNNDFIKKNNELEVLQNDHSNLIVEYQNNDGLFFQFSSKIQNGILTSNLKIFRKHQLIIETSSKINTETPAYKLMVYEKIVKQSKELKQSVKSSDLLEVKPNFEIFAKKILLIQNIVSSSLLVQSIFYHNSIMDITIRSFVQKKDCECTPHPGYFVDKTPFWCQEDYFIDVKALSEIIENSDSTFIIRKTEIVKFLTNQKDDQISIDKISTFLEKKESYMERVQRQFLIENNQLNNIPADGDDDDDCFPGSGLGCCGNYSGCCWYWSLWCLEHDLACLKCDKWHCGPACQG